jgi:hypothetical protein
MTSPEKTIHIPVSTATHVVIGCTIALIAITAFWVYTQLPSHQANYRGTAFAIALIAAFGVTSYGLLCANHRLKFHVDDNAEAIEAARAELRTAKAELFVKLDRIAARLDELGSEVGQNSGTIKELTDAVDEARNSVEVLQDCYSKEGQAPARKEIPAARKQM